MAVVASTSPLITNVQTQEMIWVEARVHARQDSDLQAKHVAQHEGAGSRTSHGNRSPDPISELITFREGGICSLPWPSFLKRSAKASLACNSG